VAPWRCGRRAGGLCPGLLAGLSDDDPAGITTLAGIPRGVAVAIAAVGVTVLVLGSNFHRVEHVLLALAAAASFSSGWRAAGPAANGCATVIGR
jgi:hypothetical protein